MTFVMTGMALCSCGGDDDVIEDIEKPTEEKGHVFTYEIILNDDADKFGVGGEITVHDNQNNSSQMTTTGDVHLDNYKSDGIMDPTTGKIYGYGRIFGNEFSMYKPDYATTSKHYSISTNKTALGSQLGLIVMSNYMASFSYPVTVDKDAELSIHIIGYIDGVKKKEGVVSYKYSCSGTLIMDLGDMWGDTEEGYYITDNLTSETIKEYW